MVMKTPDFGLAPHYCTSLTSHRRGNRIRLHMKVPALILLVAVAASAHHSFDAEFDRTKQVSLTGVVTKVEWTNPHVWFWINVKDEATGRLVNWGCEMGSPNALQRSGWTVATRKGGLIVCLTRSRA